MSLLKRIGADAPPPLPSVTPANVLPAPGAAPAPMVGTGPLAPVVGRSISVVGSDAEQDKMLDLSLQITDRILASLGTQTKLEHTAESEQMLTNSFATIYRQTGVALGADQVKQLYQMVLSEIFGFGPIDSVLNDDAVTEVMVNGPRMVYAERRGKVALSDITFRDNDHVLKIIDRIIRPLGRRVDRKQPYVDARLPDGSRVNAIIPPARSTGRRSLFASSRKTSSRSKTSSASAR